VHCLRVMRPKIHTHPFNGPFSRTTRVIFTGGTRNVKPIWILLKQETVSGSGISWAICKSAPCSRQITTPAPHHSVFYRPDALPAAQPTASKHRCDMKMQCKTNKQNWPVCDDTVLQQSMITHSFVLRLIH